MPAKNKLETKLSYLKLFFVRTGGKDLPSTSNWNKPFGYNPKVVKGVTTLGEPIFKHSISEVLSNFETPITMVHKNVMEDVKTVQDLLIIESFNNENVQMMNINSEFWNLIVEMMEFINVNESEMIKKPTKNKPTKGGPDFTCYGDQLFRCECSPEENNLYSKFTEVYEAGSLQVTSSGDLKLEGRVQRAEFSVKHLPKYVAGDSANESDTIRIDCYFDPDKYIAIGFNKNYAVYSYEDLSYMRDSVGDPTQIDDFKKEWILNKSIEKTTEFDAGLIYPVFKILSGGRFKRYIRFAESDNGGGRTDGFIGGKFVKEEKPDGSIEEKIVGGKAICYVFYIFSSLDEDEPITNDMLIGYIREYVEKKYPEDSDKAEMRARYPNLFGDSTIEIYPVVNNTTNGRESGNPKNPADPGALEEFFKDNGLGSFGAGPGHRYWEIFYVGSPEDFNNSFRQPLIALEQNGSFNKYPITKRFPRFRPFDTVPKDIEAYADTIRFHNLVIMALNDLFGRLDGKTIIGLYGDKKYKNNPIYTKDLNWKHVPPSFDPITNTNKREYVSFTFRSVTYKFVKPR